MLKSITLICTASLAFAGGAANAATTYTSEAAFVAAAGGGLAFESFETPAAVNPTTVVLNDVTVSCSGSTYCPGFFGVRQLNATDGRQTVFFATPDSATFTFSSAITAFGIDVIDLGTVGGTNFTINYVNGSSVLFSNYSGGGVLFAGVIDTIPFLSVTFSGSSPNDGIDFDRLQYKFDNAVPEPTTWLMMIAGFGLVGASQRRRASRAVVA